MFGINQDNKPPLNKLLEKIKATSNESSESGIALDITPQNAKERFKITGQHYFSSKGDRINQS